MTGIDHLVLCVRDLERARAHYQALGFTMTPPARHPFGTGNSNIQLQGCFLEVLTVMSRDDIVEHAPGHFSFSAFNRDFLDQREGFSMLVLESHDPLRDQDRFTRQHLVTYAPFEFSRQAAQPDGSRATVGFSLRFTTDPGMPAAAFFTCHQHAPELFWKPQYQTHANTAHSVAEIAIVSDHPLSHARFLTGFTGQRDVIASDERLIVETGRGRICVMKPADFENTYNSPQPDLSNGARLAGYTIAVDDLVACKAHIASSGIAHTCHPSHLVVHAHDNFATALVLKPRST